MDHISYNRLRALAQLEEGAGCCPDLSSPSGKGAGGIPDLKAFLSWALRYGSGEW